MCLWVQARPLGTKHTLATERHASKYSRSHRISNADQQRHTTTRAFTSTPDTRHTTHSKSEPDETSLHETKHITDVTKAQSPKNTQTPERIILIDTTIPPLHKNTLCPPPHHHPSIRIKQAIPAHTQSRKKRIRDESRIRKKRGKSSIRPPCHCPRHPNANDASLIKKSLLTITMEKTRNPPDRP